MNTYESQLLATTRAAYIELLAFMPPKRRDTLQGQGLLCRLRDSIAASTGNSSEQTQDEHESIAYEIYKQAVLKGEA